MFTHYRIYTISLNNNTARAVNKHTLSLTLTIYNAFLFASYFFTHNSHIYYSKPITYKKNILYSNGTIGVDKLCINGNENIDTTTLNNMNVRVVDEHFDDDRPPGIVPSNNPVFKAFFIDPKVFRKRMTYTYLIFHKLKT